MVVTGSFTDYVPKTFDNQFWAVTEEYLHENIDFLDVELYRIYKSGELEITEIQVKHVWVDDLPEMKIEFDVETLPAICKTLRFMMYPATMGKTVSKTHV